MNAVTLHYTEPLLRDAVRVFVARALYRRLGWLFFVAVALLIASTTYLIARQDHRWVVGFLVASILFTGIFIATVYVAHHRNTIGRFRHMRKPEATMLYDEKSLTFVSELGSSTIPWSSIKEMWQYPQFWLLLFSPAQFITLPLDCLDEECRVFITRKTTQRDS